MTGRRPWSELASLRELQWWPSAELDARALRKVRALVGHARSQVPYYRDLFRAAAVGPEDIESLADLSRIPTSGKMDLHIDLHVDSTRRVLACDRDFDALGSRRGTLPPEPRFAP
jgi:phenylacetate-coenzyme A ligase PaaK-like adenylate-forming protein